MDEREQLEKLQYEFDRKLGEANDAMLQTWLATYEWRIERIQAEQSRRMMLRGGGGDAHPLTLAAAKPKAKPRLQVIRA